MNYVCVKKYVGKNFALKFIEIPIGSKVERQGDFLMWKSIPFCSWRSDVAKKYFVWDDNFQARASYIYTIVEEDRLRVWTENVPVYDDSTGKVIDFKTKERVGRFSPDEVSYIKKNFPHLLTNESVLNFNDFFYTGSKITDLEKLALYCRGLA